MSVLEYVKNSVIKGDDEQVVKDVNMAIDMKEDPISIINNGLIAGMNVVGSRFKAEEMFVPEVLMSAQAMAAGVEVVQPLIKEGDITNKGTIVLGTVKGDLHDIGKKLVAIMFDSNGYNVVDIGFDVPAEKFVEAVKEHNAQIVGLSALLTTTMPEMKTVIDTLKGAGLRDKVKVIIGGAPVTEEFSEEIGADGYSPDAGSATQLADRLLA
jgi:5-methyltetrahydrofolate--homocysteine methyltransferase